MKTLKALKAASIWNCIFCFTSILSTVCLAVGTHYDIHILFDIGVLAVYGWMVNPFAIISCFRCLKVYLTERNDPDHKQMIGRKWVWIFIWPVITTVLWFISGGLFVKFTGGV